MGINHLLNGMILQVPLFLWGISIHLPHWARHGVRGPQATQFTSPLWAKSLGFGLGKHLGGWRYDVGGPQKHTIQTPHLHLRRYDWKIRKCVTWKFLIHIFTFPKYMLNISEIEANSFGNSWNFQNTIHLFGVKSVWNRAKSHPNIAKTNWWLLGPLTAASA